MRIIEPATAADLHSYYDLRWRVLRAPWDQPRGSERDAQDRHGIHLMLVDSRGKALAVGRLHFNSIREAQIRYMAVEVTQQRNGLGSRLLAALEARAQALGASHIVLDARESALGFYRRNGYTVIGSGHVLFDRIAHARMRKPVGANSAQGR